jgi:Mn2+/Fe2+ NRAMP family transporter
MAMMMIMVSQPKIMGEFTLSSGLKVMGWLSTAVMGAAVLAMFATWLG